MFVKRIKLCLSIFFGQRRINEVGHAAWVQNVSVQMSPIVQLSEISLIREFSFFVNFDFFGVFFIDFEQAFRHQNRGKSNAHQLRGQKVFFFSWESRRGDHLSIEFSSENTLDFARSLNLFRRDCGQLHPVSQDVICYKKGK